MQIVLGYFGQNVERIESAKAERKIEHREKVERAREGENGKGKRTKKGKARTMKTN